MQGNIINPFSGSSGGFKVNGIAQSYIAGSNIKKGKFVKLENNKVEQVTSSNDTILGMAKTSATSEGNVKVIVPNIESEEN